MNAYCQSLLHAICSGADLKAPFPNPLCSAGICRTMKNDSSDPKFQGATLYPLMSPRLGISASPSRRNPGSGRLAGAGRRNCKQWRPGLPRPSTHTRSQPSRRTRPRDFGFRAWNPARPAQPWACPLLSTSLRKSRVRLGRPDNHFPRA